MKRILKRMWDYNYKFYPVATGLGVICGFIILDMFSHLIRPALSASAPIKNAVDPTHATNGLVMPEDGSYMFFTNIAVGNLTNIWVPKNRSNYWAEEITIEWVTTADWLLGKQLGLRSDGVVVWKEKK